MRLKFLFEVKPPVHRPGTNKLKMTLRDRVNDWIGMWLYKRVGIRSGPFMFYSRGEWWFVDHIGNIYVLKYNAEGAYRHLPIIIELREVG